MPDNMRAWLAGYEDQLQYLATHDVEVVKLDAADGHEAIEPLITTQWDQGSPYNSQCPTDPKTKATCYTGCVATAMAQVMNYYKYPKATIATIPGYTTYTRQIQLTSISPTAIDWDNMADKYGRGYTTTTAQNKAVATLMKLCGAACEMDYTSQGSSATTDKMAEVLRTIFGYASSIRYLHRMDYCANEWVELVYNELDAGRPVLYGGQSIGGGHQFIVDGYDGNGLYHVNWGWSGDNDNYFLLSILNPESTAGAGASSSSDGYSFDQDIVIGVTPNEGEVVWPESPLALTIGGLTMNNAAEQTKRSNGTFMVNFTCGETLNYTGQNLAFDLGFGLFDNNGQLAEAAKLWTTSELGNGWFYSSWSNYAYMGASLPDGVYTLKVLSKPAGTDTWYPCYGTDTYYATVTIADKKVTMAVAEVEEPVEDLNISFAFDEEPEAKIPCTVSCTVQNNGSFYQREVFLQENGEDVGGMVLEVEAGETVTLPFSYTPSSAGEKELALAWREWSGYGGYVYHTLAKTTINVKAAGTPQLDYSLAFEGGYKQVVTEREPKVLLTLTNNGTGTFNNTIAVQLYQRVSTGQYMSYELQEEYYMSERVGAGMTKTIEVQLPELDDKSSYAVEFFYVLNGGWKQGDEPLEFTTDFSHLPEPVIMGDVNNDGVVNVTDVSELISQILGKPSESFHAEAADMNGDGTLNVTDVSLIINKILGKE